MKEHPILFTTEMVQAILQGRKTQTRRVVKNIPDESQYLKEYPAHNAMDMYPFLKPDELQKPDNEKIATVISCPFGKVGDRIWVRETWTKTMVRDEEGWFYVFKADGDDWAAPWKPSIHMPKTAARIWLYVEEVKVERVQDISEEDAIAEGVLPLLASSMQLITQGQLYFDYSKPKQFFNEGLPALWSFNSLWCSINGNESWETNPWVWVVKFKVLSTTGMKSPLPPFAKGDEERSEPASNIQP